MKKYFDINNFSARIKNFLLMAIALFSLTACESEQCPTVQQYLADGSGKKCLLCGLFRSFTNIATEVSDKAWDMTAKQLIPVVVLVAALYVAVYTLKSIGSFSKQNSADYLTGDKKGIMMLLFKTAIIVLLLENTYLITNIIVPIISAGMEIGARLSVVTAPGLGAVSANGSKWSLLFDSVNIFAEAFSEASYRTVAIAQAMICNAISVNTWGIFSWDWLVLMYGIMLFIFGWLVNIGVGFYIIDIIINLTFGAMLLPLGIACALSKFTVTYSKNIWNIFMNCFANFVLIGIMVGLSLQLVFLSMGVADPSTIRASGGAATNTFATNLEALLNANNVKELSKSLTESGSMILTIISFCVIIQLCAQIREMAAKLCEGALTSVGSQLAAEVSKPLTNGAKKLAKSGGKMAWDGAKYTGHVGSRIAHFDVASRWAKDKARRAQGFVFGTGKYGSHAFWR